MGMFNFLQDAGNYESRKVGRDDVNGLTVSTAYSSDEGYETAIIDAESVHPVERYNSKEEAIDGHQKWCKKAITIKSVVVLGWQGLVGETEKELQRTPIEIG
jgi:hypothetical protein